MYMYITWNNNSHAQHSLGTTGLEQRKAQKGYCLDTQAILYGSFPVHGEVENSKDCLLACRIYSILF